ncbi:invasion associated locus B family protein [Cognatishimia sp. MH4019]|uniref:invasion associated locus B family protein n=1 Tax=Cognatishimia sp. MH4019 TaxID=2854030 RepID=UPI001CD35E5B|nr:invasion associated locus B family protein [Cognatishimia sp. MH4019]
MSKITTLPLIALLALSGPAFAQEATTDTTTEEATPPAEDSADAPAAEEAPTDAPETDGLSLGQEVTEGPQPGDTYTRSEHGDWEIRCVKMQEGENDPCQLYQLLEDGQGNSVAEVNLFGLEGGGEVVAGANIVTPLETLLTEQMTLRIDGSNPRRYPFTFCAPIGCVSRIGLTETDVSAFKRGNEAVVSIVPLGAPDQRVNLSMSLTGFTDGYDTIVSIGGTVSAE